MNLSATASDPVYGDPDDIYHRLCFICGGLVDPRNKDFCVRGHHFRITVRLIRRQEEKSIDELINHHLVALKDHWLSHPLWEIK